MSSVSPAGKPGRRQERFASPLAVAGMFASFVLLLMVLYPEREILDRMAKMPGWSPVSMHYLQALTRIRPNDVSLQVSYAEVLVAAGRYSRAISILDATMKLMPASERWHCLELRLAALKGILDEMSPTDSQRSVVDAEFAATALQLADGSSSLNDLRRYLRQAKFAGAAAALSFLEGKDIPAPHPAITDLTEQSPGGETGDVPVQDPRAIASRMFSEMQSSADLPARRRLFMKGVGILRAANLPDEALAAAERNIDGLSDDRETLMFLTRLALAADRPLVAQGYVKRALRIISPDSTRVQR